MRFLSLFSGIEAASQAWPDWTPVAFAEIEKFPCAVLQHHYPAIPNLGDVEKITQEQIEALGHIDVVIFGFPCTDLSVGGQRKGLKNADGTSTRSGLFYTAARIAEWSRARWTLAENVPGLFSSCQGRDFGAVVGELAGCQFGIPADGWRNSGFALGPKGLVEWTTLDAQWFHLAQRRKRVFIIRDSGDWAGRPPLLLEPKSLRRHSQARRQAGKRIAPTIEARAGAGGAGWETDFMSGGGLAVDSEAKTFKEGQFGNTSETEVSETMQARGGGRQKRGGALITEAVSIGIAGGELGYALRASHSCDKGDGGINTTLIAFPQNLSSTQCAKAEDIAPAMGSKNPTAIAFTQNSRDEVRENGGNVAGALAAEPGAKQQTYVAIPINMQAAGKNGERSPNMLGIGQDGDPAPTLGASDRHAVAHSLTPDVAAPLTTKSHADNDGQENKLIPEVCGTLSDGKHNGGGELNGQDAHTQRIILTRDSLGVAGTGRQGSGQQHERGASDTDASRRFL